MIRVKDLPQSPDHGVSLLCPDCRNTYNACRGDYFLLAPDKVMFCHLDGSPLDLVRERGITYEKVEVKV
jgi:hypothetical protein